MQNKTHEAPEFQVIRMNEANAKFYAYSGPGFADAGIASDPVGGIGSSPSTVSLGKSSANGWF